MPFVPDVVELPVRLEAVRDVDEPAALVERARAGVARERVEPQAAARLRLRPVEHRSSDAAALEAEEDVELDDRLACRGDESGEVAVGERDAHVGLREHLAQEVRALLGERVRVDDAYRRLEARAPPRDERVEARGVVGGEGQGVHRRSARLSPPAPAAVTRTRARGSARAHGRGARTARGS
jgi:hypothetical protein